MVSLQTADIALKNFYLDAVTRELDAKVSPFLAKLEKSSAYVTGKDINKIIKLGINGGVAAGSETGDLPKGDSCDYITFKSTLKNLYGTIEITDKAIRASANDEGGFVNLLNEEMDGLVKSAKYNFSRMLFGDGNGYLATVVSAGTTAGVLTSINGLIPGMYIDFWKDGKRTHSKIKITAVDKNRRSIEMTGADLSNAGAPSAGSDVRVCGCEDGYELTGLAALFSPDNIYGVNRTSEYMRPFIEDSIGELSEDIVQTAIDTIEQISGSKVNFILCSWGVRRALTRCIKERQAILSMTDLGDNQYVLTYNGIPVVADRFCPEGTMYLLNTDDFKLCQLCDWQWMEGEDGKILKQVAGKPIYTATLVKYAELICERPCGQGMLTDIDV